MLMRLAKDSVVYGGSALLVRGIQIFLIPIYTRVLGSGEYGIVETVAIAGALVNLTVALEISQGVARYMADAKDDVQRRGYASTAVTFALFAYGAFMALAWLASRPLASALFGSERMSEVVVVAAAALAVNGIFVLMQDLLRWQLQPGAYVRASLCYVVVGGGTGVYLVTTAGTGVQGVFWGQLAGACAGGLVAGLATASSVGIGFDRARLARMLAYSLPLVLSGAAVFGNLFVDRIVVKQLLGTGELGIYGVAARFASTVTILTVGLQAALSPLVFRNHADPATPVMLGRAFRYYCVMMIFVVGGLSLFSTEILLVLTGPEFRAGRTVMPMLAAAAMFSMLYIFSPGLFLGKKTGRVAATNLAGAILNLVLCLAFVPGLGMLGAAAAAATSGACVFAGYAVPGQRYYRVPFAPFRATAALGGMGLLVALGLWWNTMPASWDPLQASLKLIVLISVGIAAILLGLEESDRTIVFDKLRAMRHKPTIRGA